MTGKIENRHLAFFSCRKLFIHISFTIHVPFLEVNEVLIVSFSVIEVSSVFLHKTYCSCILVITYNGGYCT